MLELNAAENALRKLHRAGALANIGGNAKASQILVLGAYIADPTAEGVHVH